MKKIGILFVMLTCLNAVAEIRGSSYEARHQSAIENEIYKQCGYSGVVIEKEAIETAVRIDNGVEDTLFTTTLEVRIGLDQYDYDSKIVVVDSRKSDMYDHVYEQWGAYSVDYVKCN